MVRLPVSKMAAIAGLHPYADVAELALELVYQDRHHILLQDADNLGVQLISRQEETHQLARKVAAAGPAASAAMKQAEAAAAGVPSVKAASGVKSAAQTAINTAVAMRKLTAAEADTLQAELRKNVDTGFGSRHEDAALDAYEQQTGWEVKERNERFVRWDIPLELEDDAADHAASAPDQSSFAAERSPKRARSSGDSESHAAAKPTAVVDLTGTSDDEADKLQEEVSASAVPDAAAASAQPATIGGLGAQFFTIVGTVDGISEQLDASADDPEQWRITRRVIEVKHRMSRECEPFILSLRAHVVTRAAADATHHTA